MNLVYHSDSTNRWRIAILVFALLPALRLLGPDAPGVFAPWTQMEALLLWVLCLLPGWIYVGTKPSLRPPLPFLPLYGVVFGAYYALPLVLGQTDLGGFGGYLRKEDYNAAADAALLGWAGVLAGTVLTRGRSAPSAPLPPLDTYRLMLWAVGLALLSPVLDILGFSTSLPAVLKSLTLLITIMGRFGLALGILLYLRGHGGPIHALGLVVAGLLMVLSILISGLMAGMMFMGVTIMFALWVGRGHLRYRELVAACMLVGLVVSLKSVLPDFRDEAWFRGRQMSASERVELMGRLVQQRLEIGGASGLLEEGRDRTKERSAAADMLADVIQRTPSPVPYWKGGSYVSLVGALVPRVLWPDKPQKDLGQRFGHRYGYLASGNTSTSINFPWLIEMYANFGMAFMPVGGLIVGAILGLLGRWLNRPGQDGITTAMGIGLLVPLYNIESDFSLVYGGLILYGLAVAAIVRWIQGTATLHRVAPAPRLGASHQVPAA